MSHLSRKLNVSVRLLVCSIIAAVAVGCTVLTSELPATLEREGRAPGGVHYFLPMATMDLTLSVDGDRAQIRVTPGPLKWIADPSQRYYIRYRPLPQYHDVIDIRLQADKGFLKNITSNTTDETPTIIENLAQAFGAFGLESAVYPYAEKQLAKLTVDPTSQPSLDDAAARFGKAVNEYAEGRRATACKPDENATIILEPTRKALCDEYTALATAKRPVRLAVERLDLDDGVSGGDGSHTPRHSRPAAQTPLAEPEAEVKADCSVGICYRSPMAYELKLAVGKSVHRQILLVPNRSQLVEIDIRRTFLVNKTQTIEFDPDTGLLQSIQVAKDSELKALSALPLTVIKGITDGLALRVKLVTTQRKQADARKSLIEEQANLARQRALLESAISYRARYGSGAAGTASISSVPSVKPRAAAGAAQGAFVDREPPIDSKKD